MLRRRGPRSYHHSRSRDFFRSSSIYWCLLCFRRYREAKRSGGGDDGKGCCFDGVVLSSCVCFVLLTLKGARAFDVVCKLNTHPPYHHHHIHRHQHKILPFISTSHREAVSQLCVRNIYNTQRDNNNTRPQQDGKKLSFVRSKPARNSTHHTRETVIINMMLLRLMTVRYDTIRPS